MLEPRWYQKEAIEAPFKYWESHCGNPLIQAPTGSGKSLIIAEFCKRCMSYEGTRILVLAHVKELLEQNEAEMLGQWPEADVGVYSAGLKRKELRNAITIAGIQSIYKKSVVLGKVDLVIIDEAHLVPQKSMGRYRRLLHDLSQKNPHMKVVGYTATPWRLGGGCLTDGNDSIFSRVIYSISVSSLIRDGHLCNVKALSTHGTADFSKLKKSGNGEFTEMSILEAIQANDNTNVAISEAIELGKDCKSWLVFCAGVEHAKNICQKLNDNGVVAKVLVGETDKKERAAIIEELRSNKIRALVSVSCITTGLNVRNVDFMLCLRATQSSSLWVQMVGRIMRTHPDKKVALIADYGDNIERHGPIEDIKPPKPTKVGLQKKKECPSCGHKTATSSKTCGSCGYIYTRPCPNCDKPNPMDVGECSYCGYAFITERTPAIMNKAKGGEVISGSREKWVDVDDVIFKRHVKKGKPDNVRINYVCGGMVYSEWISPFDDGAARIRASKFYHDSGILKLPKNMEEALTMKVRPKKICVVRDGDYNKVVRRLWK